MSKMTIIYINTGGSAKKLIFLSELILGQNSVSEKLKMIYFEK
jgi:hypothetical protein